MRGLARVLAVLAAGCLEAPPDATPPQADAGDPCGALETEGCALFTCPGSPSCYLLCLAETSFEDARASCEGPGRKLLETEGRAEMACVQEFNLSHVWLGLVQDDDAEQPGEGWTWLSNDLPPLEAMWDEIEPNDGVEPEDGQEQCAVVHHDFGEWADAECEPMLASPLCEITPP